jgi:YihY family inner membrane protein
MPLLIRESGSDDGQVMQEAFKKRALRASGTFFEIVRELYGKYQRDNGRLIVSSIAFNVLLTFIPFTLLSLFVLGFVIDVSQAGVHVGKLLKAIIPDPYNAIVIKRLMKEMNFISASKKLSGPLGLATLLFFSVRLFSSIRSGFRIIFGRSPESFFKGAGKELLVTLVFTLLQAVLFFSFIFTVVIQTKAVKAFPGFIGKTPTIAFFSFLDVFFTFAMFYMIYYALTPARKAKHILFWTTVGATLFWHIGRTLFKHYVIYLAKVTAFFGTYGVFIAFLFWLYFSVFIFINCAELQSILLKGVNRGREPSFPPRQETP